MRTYQKVLLGLAALIVVAILAAVLMTQGVADAARSQLAAIRAGDAAKAYALTSSAFQKQTGFEEFRRFITTFPPFVENERATFSERQVDNGIGTLRGELVAKNGSRTPVEYRLVKENGEWRVEGVKFDSASVQAQAQAAAAATPAPSPRESLAAPPAVPADAGSRQPGSVAEAGSRPPSRDAARQAGPPSAGTIAGILISDVANETGYVFREKPSIDRTMPKIYVTVQVADASRGAHVSATIIRLATGASIGPLRDDITADGNVMKAFSFTNTQAEWPSGAFRAVVTLSDGSARTKDFTVR